MKTKLKALGMVLVLMIFFAGCGTGTVGKAYDSLKTSAIVYDAGMSYAGDEYKSGRISEETKDDIIEAAKRYRLAVETGTKALKAYMLADMRDEGLTEAESALATAMDAIDIAREALEKFLRMEDGS